MGKISCAAAAVVLAVWASACSDALPSIPSYEADAAAPSPETLPAVAPSASAPIEKAPTTLSDAGAMGDAAADAPVDPPPVVDPNAGAGPAPSATCTVSKDQYGFFVRTSTKSSYVAYVPPGYDGSAPARLVVGLHGCGDSAMNFATWAMAPWDTRATQDHIAISIGGKDGQCWTNGTDDDKVLAAVDDLSTCFWIHQQKITIAGYSSGGGLAYRVGLEHADRFAGILIEDSAAYGAGGAGISEDTLLAGASWKLNIAHLTHTSDADYTLSQVLTDWTKITSDGFPLVTQQTAGTHDGTGTDWSGWLLPQSESFVHP